MRVPLALVVLCAASAPRRRWGASAATPAPTPEAEEGECFAAPAVPHDRRRDPTRLSIAQFNMEWLFLSSSPPTGSGIACPCVGESGSGSCCEWSESDSEIHLRYIALALARVDADVVNVAEVQDCAVLRRLLALLPAGHGYEPYLRFGADTATGQNVALLTRVDPEVALARSEERLGYPRAGATCCADASDGCYGASGTSACTKHYVTRLPALDGLDNTPIVLAGAHLLANPSDELRCLKREAQAGVVSNAIAADVAAGAHAVVFGDLNTFDAAAVDAGGRLPIDRTLEIFKRAVAGALPLDGGALDDDGDAEIALGENALARVPQAERYSEWWDIDADCEYEPLATPSEVSLLDHIVLSPSLAAKIANVTVHHDWAGACVADSGYNSDHWPVSVTLDLSIGGGGGGGGGSVDAADGGGAEETVACDAVPTVYVQSPKLTLALLTAGCAWLGVLGACAAHARAAAGDGSSSSRSSSMGRGGGLRRPPRGGGSAAAPGRAFEAMDDDDEVKREEEEEDDEQQQQQRRGATKVQLEMTTVPLD